MQGQRGAGNSIAETIDLNQGSVSSNNGSNLPSGWNSMLYPVDNHNVRNFGGWHVGESSSSTNLNLQLQGLGGNIKSESPFDSPPQVRLSNSLFQENLSRPSSGSSHMPRNFNLNVEHMETDDAFPYNLENNNVEHMKTENAFPYDVENNNGSSSSFGDWGSTVKRKDLDNASSSCFQQGETFDRQNIHNSSSTLRLGTYSPPLHRPSFSHSEELNLRIGLGRGVSSASEVFPPISVTETGESSSRTYGARVNHENDRFNLRSTRNSVNSSGFYNRHQSSRPVSPSESFEFRPVSTRTPDLPGNTPSFVSRRGPERGFLSRDEIPPGRYLEIRNNQNSSHENVRAPVSHFPSPWARLQQHDSSRNIQRSSQFYPWAGSNSSEETMMPSGSDQGPHRTSPFSRSSMTEVPGEDVSGWHAVAAGIEGRHRVVSEIRQVLNAMRRGDNLRDEDYLLFDPYINGTAEIHDRHRDMRLDVDDMSYEELLALEERIGDVNTGLSEDSILKTLKQRKHLCVLDRSLSALESCSICREDYVLGDNVGELDCGHDFHTDCVKQWLTLKNICPICKMTALDTGE